MRRKDKLLDIVYDIYREMYQRAEPSADFDLLVETAEVVDGKKVIPYTSYKIDDNLMMEILNRHLSNHKLTRQEKDAIKFEVLLGVSPMSK